MRWLLVALACTACISTPRRPPIATPARGEMETLMRRHFMQRTATAVERARLAVLLDLHGRGAEAALLEAPDDPARAERAWFDGPPDALFRPPAEARAALPKTQARLATDPRAVRTLWLLGRAAGLPVEWQQAVARQWRDDWPESTDARRAWGINQAERAPPAPAVDLDAWAAAHPIDLPELKRSYAGWTPPPGFTPPRWLAWRMLAVWDGARFRLREERVALDGRVEVRRRRAAAVPTSARDAIFRLSVRVWGAPVEARGGAVSPLRSEGRWQADVDGIDGRRLDAWAPSPGPRWVHAHAATPTERRARLRWSLTPSGEGWRGSLEGDGALPDLDPLRRWLPTLRVHAVRRLPGARWRAQVAFPGAPTRSLLDDGAVEALGGPISMRRLATAERREPLSLPSARVEIEVGAPAPSGPLEGDASAASGWTHRIEQTDQRVRARWRRPAVSWTPAQFEERRERARRIHRAMRDAVSPGHPLAPLLLPKEE